MGEFRSIANDELMRRGAERRRAKFEEARERIGGLVGCGEAADGKVTGTWTAVGPSDLKIDPRAMRMGSDELAKAVLVALRQAEADLRQQVKQVTDEEFGDDVRGTRAGADRLDDDVVRFGRAMDELSTDVDRVIRRNLDR